VGMSGNLEPNSNSQILFLDIKPGGQNLLMTEIAPDALELSCPSNGPPSAVQGLGRALVTNQETGATERSGDPAATLLDAGFEPERAIAINTSGGTLFVTQYDLYSAPQGIWDDPGTPENGDCTEPPVEALDYYATRIYRGEIGVNVSGG